MSKPLNSHDFLLVPQNLSMNLNLIISGAEETFTFYVWEPSGCIRATNVSMFLSVALIY